MPTTRLEAFSDGVFAIAITLLVLSLHAPDASNRDVASALLAEWPSFATFAVSFLVIGIIWVNHHAIFSHIARTDRTLLFLNLILLMVVAFLPFPSGLLGEYIQAGHDASTAAVVYSASMTLMAISFNATWRWAAHRSRLLEEGFPPATARAVTRRMTLGLPIYAVSIGLAFVNAEICLVIYGLLAIYYALDRTSVAVARE